RERPGNRTRPAVRTPADRRVFAERRRWDMRDASAMLPHRRMRRTPRVDRSRAAAMAAAAPKARTVDKLMLLHRALADNRLGKADVTILATVVEATHTKYGFAWASVGSIAQVVGVSRRYVQLALRKLESLGYLRIELGGRGPKSTNRY